MTKIKRKVLQVLLRGLFILGGDRLATVAVRAFRKTGPQGLEKILLHLSSGCNYRCAYCYADKSTGVMVLEDWLALVEQGARLGVRKVALLGGEPLLSDDIWLLLDKIRCLKMEPFIYTNGSLLTPDMMVRLLPYGPLLVVKYDAGGDTYKAHTGQDGFSLEQIEANIREARRKGLRVITFIPLLKNNHLRIVEIVERSISLGAFPVIERYMPVADKRGNSNFEISDHEYFQAVDRARSVIVRILRGKGFPYIIPGGGCACYRRSLSVMSSGDVLPCPYLPVGCSLGNVKCQDLAAIYGILQIKKKGEYAPAAMCHGCAQFEECAGGCRTHSYYQHGAFSGYCHPENFALHCGFSFVDVYGDII